MLTCSPGIRRKWQILESDSGLPNLGLNPSNDGKLVRFPFRRSREERRKQLAKQVHEIAEEHRTAIRNIRRDGERQLKKMLKDKSFPRMRTRRIGRGAKIDRHIHLED